MRTLFMAMFAMVVAALPSAAQAQTQEGYRMAILGSSSTPDANADLIDAHKFHGIIDMIGKVLNVGTRET